MLCIVPGADTSPRLLAGADGIVFGLAVASSRRANHKKKAARTCTALQCWRAVQVALRWDGCEGQGLFLLELRAPSGAGLQSRQVGVHRCGLVPGFGCQCGSMQMYVIWPSTGAHATWSGRGAVVSLRLGRPGRQHILSVPAAARRSSKSKEPEPQPQEPEAVEAAPRRGRRQSKAPTQQPEPEPQQHAVALEEPEYTGPEDYTMEEMAADGLRCACACAGCMLQWV